MIDNLSYFYSGNRLTGVSDAVSGNPNVGDFRASGNSSNYTYYPNGSLKSDANKGISLIEYNTYLNKVKQVTWSDGRWLKFNYDGASSLIKKENSAGEYWDYVGDLVYKNGINYSINNPEGRVVFTNNSWNYEYDYRDIWGNLRLSFAAENGQLKVKQQSDYDPFGYTFNQFAGVNKNFFKYQKQQRIEDFNLNIDFFKFRPSDPTIGRFWMVDPLSSDYAYNSVYALQENKFGKGVELEGLELGPFPLPALLPAIEVLAEGLIVAGQAIAGSAAGIAVIDMMKSASEKPGVGKGIQDGSIPLWVQQRRDQMYNSEGGGSKKAPNPDGKKGGEKHQATSKKEADRMTSEGKVVRPEVKIPTPDGKKTSRYVDQTGTDPKTGKKEMIQVGKQNKNGTPVKRERDAMDDIEKATGERPKFVPYNN